MRLSGPFASPPPRKPPKVKRDTDQERAEKNSCWVCGVEVGDRAKACSQHRHALNRKPRERACDQCGKTFIPFPSQISRSASRYCSITCYRVVQEVRPAFIAVKCENCGNYFRRNRVQVRRSKHHFCSPRCSNEYMSGELHHAYRGGERHRRGPGWEANRRACRERDTVCRSCGKTPEENGQALSVDHVIPWRLFADERVANEIDNLVGLCRVCHAKKTGRAESAYVRGDVLAWLSFLRDVQIDPASLLRFEPFLRVESVA